MPLAPPPTPYVVPIDLPPEYSSLPSLEVVEESPLEAIQDLREAVVEAGLWSGEFNPFPLRTALGLLYISDFDDDSSDDDEFSSTVFSEHSGDSDSLWLSFK